MRAAIGCALTLMILSSPACYTTKVVSTDEALASRRVWLTLSDQSVVVVVDPKVNGTTLVGFVNGKYEEFPPARVKEARLSQLHGARTAALVAASVVGFAVLAGAAKGAREPSYCDAPEHVNTAICQPGPPFYLRSQ